MMLIVRSMLARIKAIFISSVSLSALYIRPPWYQFNRSNFMISVPHMRIFNTLIPLILKYNWYEALFLHRVYS